MVHLGVGVRPSVVGIISSKRTVIGQDFDLRHLHSVSHLDSNQEPKYDLELCFSYIQNIDRAARDPWDSHWSIRPRTAEDKFVQVRTQTYGVGLNLIGDRGEFVLGQG